MLVEVFKNPNKFAFSNQPSTYQPYTKRRILIHIWPCKERTSRNEILWLIFIQLNEQSKMILRVKQMPKPN